MAARTQRVDDVADWRSGTLRLARVCKGVAAPPGRATSTCSRLLYDTLGVVYDWLGFDIVDDPVFRDLVIARLVEPTSKADAARVLTDLGAETVSYKTIQRHLARINTGNYRDAIAAQCFTHAADRGGLSLLLYDVTTLYFEAENEDELRKVGYSKERRIDPQIVVGLLVDRTGFPLEVGCFEGNTAETTTLVPIITTFASRHELGDTPMVIAADAGMLSASNLAALDEAELGFIVGSRSVKAPIDLASHFHWNGDVFTDGQIIDTVTPRHAKHVVNDPAPHCDEIVVRSERILAVDHRTDGKVIQVTGTQREMRSTAGVHRGCRAIVRPERHQHGVHQPRRLPGGREGEPRLIRDVRARAPLPQLLGIRRIPLRDRRRGQKGAKAQSSLLDHARPDAVARPSAVRSNGRGTLRRRCRPSRHGDQIGTDRPRQPEPW